MKKIIPIALLYFLMFTASAQKWTKTLGLTNHNESSSDLMETYDKGYLVVGYDVLQNVSVKGWNIKTNINGNMLWDQKMIHPFGMEGKAVCQDQSGNIYVTGIDFSNNSNRPFLIKFNSCSQKVWCKQFINHDLETEAPIDILIKSDGDIVVLLQVNSPDNTIQVVVECISPEGELLWQKPFASKIDYPLLGLTIVSKLYYFGDSYYISGYCYYPYPEDPTHFWMRPFFIGIDSLFNEKWILPFGVNDSIVGKAYSAIPLNDSVIMGVGYNVVEQSGYYGRASMMMFFNRQGEELGFKVIQRDSIAPGTKGNALIEMKKANDSLFVASAVFGPSTVFNPFGDMLIDTAGRVFKSVSHPNSIGILSQIKTFDNKYVIACAVNEADMNHTNIYLYKINANLEQDTLYTQNFVYDSLCPDPIESGDIDMTNCTLVQVSIDEAPTPEEYYKGLDAIPVKAYPNPADDWIRFDYKNTERHQDIKLVCYDINGQSVCTEHIATGQQGSKMNVSGWSSGIYMAIVSSGGKLVGKTKFIVK